MKRTCPAAPTRPAIPTDIVIEPASRRSRPVYWINADLKTLGPAIVEYLARVGSGPQAAFWVVLLYEGAPRWVRADQLCGPPPAWLVTYRDSSGRLRGGADERDAGTIRECRRDGSRWMVHLTNGTVLPLRKITAVSIPGEDGRILAAWQTRWYGPEGREQAERMFRQHPPSLRPVSQVTQPVMNGASDTTGPLDGVTGKSAPGESEGRVGKTAPAPNAAEREAGLSRASNG